MNPCHHVRGAIHTTSRWTENDIPDQTERVTIVTGANSGIGWDTARAIAQKGATVIMACRNMQKANPAADQIKTFNPAGNVVVMPLDLADLDSVRAFTAAFRESYDRLDVLINNAGVMNTPYGKTAQGVEQQFGTNHLGHFALTGLLIDLLNATPQARIVTVSSGGHRFGVINFDDLNWEQGYPPQRAYAQSKLANLLFTYELQRKLSAAGQGTLAVAAHPGWTATHLQQHSRYLRLLNPLIAQTAAMGALPILYAATAMDVRGGDYVGPGGFMELRGYPQKVKSSARSHDEAAAQRLWAVSEDITQVKFHLEAV
jgi:NAD(P)-dependent dehydrogenase (short-subunit alcohol dehydrogenase family)